MSQVEDSRFMRRALGLARRGVGEASPNPTVGCVIVRDGEIIGEGWHAYEARDHAEIRALDAAGPRAHGATVYVTLEPCAHRGRTGPCAEALVRAGVRRVVAALVDPNTRVHGRGLERLRRAGIEVELGVCASEAQRLVEAFACHVTTGLPLVVGKVGMSLDGRIATASGASRWITSPDALRFGQRLRFELDALVVGVGTVRADDPALTYRGRRQKVRPLVRVVLDSHLRTPPRARIFETVASTPVLIFCRPGAPARRRKALEARGAEVVPVPPLGGRVDPRRVLELLGKRRILGVLVEGGSAIHWSFAAAELYDKFYFIVAPLVLGGARALSPFGGEGFPNIAEAPRFRITRRFRAGPDTVLEAYPSYSRSIASPWPRRETAPSGATATARASARR